MAATAFPVLARILTDRGLHRTRIGGLALASAAVADVLAWSLLAVVVALAGSSPQWRMLLAIPYAAVMFWSSGPCCGGSRVPASRRARSPPTSWPPAGRAAAVLRATNWMGLHFIFGAFLFGAVMPREAVLGMREEILVRLEQISVLVLLPIYFVVAGLSINLSTIGHSGLVELSAILLVAIAGKLAGAFGGASSPVSVAAAPRYRHPDEHPWAHRDRDPRFGLQLHILDQSLYSLMVIMALVTTTMSGPLLHSIYPDRVMAHDIAAMRADWRLARVSAPSWRR